MDKAGLKLTVSSKMTLNLSLPSSCLDSLIAEIADGHHNKSYSAGDQTQGFTHAGQELNHWVPASVLWLLTLPSSSISPSK